MNKKILSVCFMIVLMAVVLAGCNETLSGGLSDEEKKFVGTWQEAEYYWHSYTFFSDGACSFGGEAGDYELKDGKFVINIFSSGLSLVYDYVFSNNDNTLTLTRASQTTVLNKQ